MFRNSKPKVECRHVKGKDGKESAERWFNKCLQSSEAGPKDLRFEYEDTHRISGLFTVHFEQVGESDDVKVHVMKVRLAV